MAQVDAVQVEPEELLLAEGPLQSRRQDGLAGLAPEVLPRALGEALRGHEQRLGGLLGDGGAALDLLPAQVGVHPGAQRPLPVDAVVLEEVLVLGGQEGLHHVARDAVVGHHPAPFLEELSHDLPVRADQLGHHRGPVLGERGHGRKACERARRSRPPPRRAPRWRAPGRGRGTSAGPCATARAAEGARRGPASPPADGVGRAARPSGGTVGRPGRWINALRVEVGAPQDLGELGRQRALDPHRRAGDRVRDLELPGVQEHAPESPPAARLPVEGEVPVAPVAGHRVPHGLEVAADLVGAPGLDAHRQEGRVVVRGGHLPAGDGFLEVHAAPVPGAGGLLVLGERQLDDAAGARHLALGERQVGLADLVTLREQLPEPDHGLAGLGREHDAARVPVEPVGRAGAELSRRQVPGHAQVGAHLVHQRGPLDPAAGVGGQAGRLVHDQHVLVLVQDAEGLLHGSCTPGRSLGRDEQLLLVAADGDPVSVGEQLLRPAARAVHPDLAGAEHLVDVGERHVAQRAPDVLVEALPGGVGADGELDHQSSICADSSRGSARTPSRRSSFANGPAWPCSVKTREAPVARA